MPSFTVVQHKSGTGSSNTCTVTLTSTGAGNALVVTANYGISTGAGGANLTSVTLGGSGTGFGSAYHTGSPSNVVGDFAVWVNYSIAGGQTSLTVTAPSGYAPIEVDVYEVAGGLTALDKTATSGASGTTGTWTSTSAGILSQAVEFAVGMVAAWNNAGTAFTLTGPSAPWVNETELVPGTNMGSMSGYQITSSTAALTWAGTANTTGTNLYYAAVIATFTGSGVSHPGTAALSGAGTLTGAGVFAGVSLLSGSGTLTGTSAHTHTIRGIGAAALSGSGTLTGAGTGTFTQTAALSGLGTLAATWIGLLQQPPAALSGAGTLGVSGETRSYPAPLAGQGTLSVLQATGGLVFASPGAATPQAYPGTSQVAVAPPGTSNWMYLGTLGAVTALTYSFTCPGGADKMTCTIMVPATYRTQAFNPGWMVRITRGGHIVWTGRLDEPVPSAAGWTLTAVGDGNRGTDFLALYTSTWPANQPDEAVSQAITRGLPWINPGIGQPAGAWFGQQIDPGGQTITALLNLICTRGGLTWYVNSQPGGLPGTDLTVFPLPTAPNRLLTVSTPVGRTLGGDINTIVIRYQATADSSSNNGSPATYATVTAVNQASVQAHGTIETHLDLADVGVQSAAAAKQVGLNILAIYQRASFTHPITGHYGDLMNMGGVPIDPGTDQAATMCRAILTDYSYGGEVAPGSPIQFITGAYEWDDYAQTFTLTPMVTLDQSLSGMLSAANTVMTPITAAG